MSDLKEGKGNRVWEGEQPSSTKTEKEERKRRKPDVENILSGERKKNKGKRRMGKAGGEETKRRGGGSKTGRTAMSHRAVNQHRKHESRFPRAWRLRMAGAQNPMKS